MSSDWYEMLSLMSCCVALTVECSTGLVQLSRNCARHSWCSLHVAQSSIHDQQTDFDLDLDCLPLEQAYQSHWMASVHEAHCTSEAPPWKRYVHRLVSTKRHLWAPVERSPTLICHRKGVLRYSLQIVVIWCHMQVVQQAGSYSNQIDMRWTR